MKLTRTIHAGVQVVTGAAAEMLPDIAVLPGADGTPADRVLLFVDGQLGEAHGFMFTAAELTELGHLLAAPSIEVHRSLPPEANGGPR